MKIEWLVHNHGTCPVCRKPVDDQKSDGVAEEVHPTPMEVEPTTEELVSEPSLIPTENDSAEKEPSVPVELQASSEEAPTTQTEALELATQTESDSGSEPKHDREQTAFGMRRGFLLNNSKTNKQKKPDHEPSFSGFKKGFLLKDQ